MKTVIRERSLAAGLPKSRSLRNIFNMEMISHQALDLTNSGLAFRNDFVSDKGFLSSPLKKSRGSKGLMIILASTITPQCWHFLLILEINKIMMLTGKLGIENYIRQHLD